MYSPNNYKQQSATILYLIIGLNSLSILLAGIVWPLAVGFVGLLFGFNMYYWTYSVPSNSIIWREVRLFIVAITGVSLGVLLMWFSCGFLDVTMCSSPNQFKAQIFLSYFLVLPFLLLSWLFYRLPLLIRELKRKR